MAGGLQGCLEYRVGWIQRLVLLVAGVVCVWPTGMALQLVSAAVVVAMLAANIVLRERAAAV
jgi:TRAP-type uncharacterized transport system fused permease subunit